MELNLFAAVSTVHVPASARQTIDTMLAAATPDHSGRVQLEFAGLPLEPHHFGFWLHIGDPELLGQHHPDRTGAFDRLLNRAANAGAIWVLFDRDAPPAPDLPQFPDEI